MRTWRHALIVLLAVPALVAASTPAPQTVMNGAQGPLQVATAEVTMDQAVKMVEQRYHARVVKAESQRDNGRTIYVLRLLNDAGKVWTVHVDAASGAVGSNRLGHVRGQHARPGGRGRGGTARGAEGAPGSRGLHGRRRPRRR